MTFVEKRPVLAPGSSRNAAVAFELVKDEMASLDADELARINVDIPRAVATVLSALPALLALRPTIARDLPTFGRTRFLLVVPRWAGWHLRATGRR